jgi:coenzyme Q-binding protein COQ10
LPEHREIRFLPFSREQLFDLVADVGAYAEFLPWVVATRIKSKSATELVADMIVGFSMFREKFTSRVVLERPEHIHIDYLSGPLKFLYNDWRFEAADGGTNIDFHVDFAFRQSMMNTLAHNMFDEAFRRMVSAFERRAYELYSAAGSSSSSAQSTA